MSSPQMSNVMMQHLIVDERLVRSGTEYLAPMVDLSAREGTTAMSSTIMTAYVGIRLYHFFRPAPKTSSRPSELLTVQTAT